jgi:coniferyl-aldehyde dehydrogenase
VIGNIVPWNFPFDIGVGPSSRCSRREPGRGQAVGLHPRVRELLSDMLAATFDADHVTTAVGGLELARTFPTLRWDHLLYTGSPASAASS